MKCSFCGADIPPGTGKIVVKPDGSFLTFCSRKCERNMLGLKRSPQKIKWTSKYHEEKEIRLFGKEKKKKKAEERTEEKPKKKRLSKKERRELRKQKKLEKKKAKLERKKAKESAEEKASGEEGGEAQ